MKISDNNKVMIGIVVFFAFFGVMWAVQYFGTQTPGSFLERDEYNDLFYVRLYPDGQRVTSHLVPALIGTNVNRNEDGSWRVYRIYEAVMPSGAKISFEGDVVKLGATVKVFDDKERYWGVQLTNRRVRD